MILGLDLSLTRTGVAAQWADGTHTTDVIAPPDGHISGRLRHVQDRVTALVRELPVTHIVIEDLPRNPRYGGTALGMIHATFWLAIRNFSIDVTAVTPASLKTFATGSGNAAKAAVLTEAVRRLGYQGHDDNEADALWLAQIGARLLGWGCVIELPKTHLRALDKLAAAA